MKNFLRPLGLLALALLTAACPQRPDREILFQVQPTRAMQASVEAAAQTVQESLNRLGLQDAIVLPEGEDRIAVRVGGADDTPELRRKILADAPNLVLVGERVAEP